jgi:hypothetical protein
MVRLLLQRRGYVDCTTRVDARALAPLSSRQDDACQMPTLEGTKEPGVVVRPRMCESKIKGFALRAFKRLSAHRFRRHVQNAPPRILAPRMDTVTRWPLTRRAHLRCRTTEHHNG